MKSKKGLEAPRAIVYTLYVSFILIFGIFIIIAFTENMCTITIDRASNLDYNTLASRVLYSSDCLAVERDYTVGSTTHHYVDAAVLDKSKIEDGKALATLEGPEGCIENPPDILGKAKNYPQGLYDIEIRELGAEGDFIYGEGNCDGSSWQRSEDILVLIDDGNELKNGVVTFCIEVYFDEDLYSDECIEKPEVQVEGE